MAIKYHVDVKGTPTEDELKRVREEFEREVLDDGEDVLVTAGVDVTDLDAIADAVADRVIDRFEGHTFVEHTGDRDE